MNEDPTKELPLSTEEKINQLFLMTRNVIQGLNQLDTRMTTLEQEIASLKAGTNPFWQIMHDRQEQIWETVQEQGARLDRLDAHLQQQDEKMEDGFRKLKDKFELLLEDTLEWRADVRDLKRRVTRLEPIN